MTAFARGVALGVSLCVAAVALCLYMGLLFPACVLPNPTPLYAALGAAAGAAAAIAIQTA